MEPMDEQSQSSCPCGSGVAFADCCGKKQSILPVRVASPDAQALHWAKLQEIWEQEQLYGDVKPLISALHQGQQFVVVGNEIHFSEKWRTFPDFLFDYVKLTFGADWWKAEFTKPETDRHPVVQWCVNLCRLQKQEQPNPDGRFAMVPDGLAKAYLLLGYDLYVVRHHQQLQTRLVNRLKQARQFQGARHELFVVATLIRAGFDIEFEKETGVATKHAELKATHRRTQKSIGVEAKSRQRPGVLGFPGEREYDDDLKLGIHRKLNEAAAQAGSHPLAIFLELNLPPTFVSARIPSLREEIRAIIATIATERDGVWPFGLVVITNYPHHYGDFGAPDPPRLNYISQPGNADGPLVDTQIVDAIERSIRQYGNIPNFFPVQ